MVDSLIDPDSSDWNINLINQIFLPNNATYILSIPLSCHKLQDHMIWAYTPRERFTVNSAYRGVLSITQTSVLAEKSHDTACVLAPETIGHLFWDCTVAKDVWNLSNIPFDKNKINHRDFMDFLWNLLFKQHMGTELIKLLIIMAWSVWFNHNKTQLGEARQLAHEFLRRARSLLQEYQLAHLWPTQFKEATDGRWVPPTFPWYKVNVDAVVFSHLSMIGVGVIIRDHVGSVIAALRKRLPLPLGPLEAEAKALDEDTIFAWDIGVKDVIFETDSTTICHVIESPINALISISTIVLGICSRLCEFRTFQSSHVGRQGN
ncbi:uncharacterized protein LOC115961615 [Quercus lobata]|uniref:uncharacterized protein LOC115961615 n=1 Tax=Quercus lobata TaxID=97700 RepID=UPI00124547B1|nr:uncharacterized protein LOC115961615 [Quercus lobata]